jgi:hypothetical protein
MKSILILAAMAMVASPLTAATPCRDAHGKFIKCPQKAAAKAKPKQCRDSKGKFIKCK